MKDDLTVIVLAPMPIGQNFADLLYQLLKYHACSSIQRIRNNTKQNWNTQHAIVTGTISGSDLINSFTPSGANGAHNAHTTVIVATEPAIINLNNLDMVEPPIEIFEGFHLPTL